MVENEFQNATEFAKYNNTIIPNRNEIEDNVKNRISKFETLVKQNTNNLFLAQLEQGKLNKKDKDILNNELNIRIRDYITNS
jgi:hypothetical protein